MDALQWAAVAVVPQAVESQRFLRKIRLRGVLKTEARSKLNDAVAVDVVVVVVVVAVVAVVAVATVAAAVAGDGTVTVDVVVMETGMVIWDTATGLVVVEDVAVVGVVADVVTEDAVVIAALLVWDSGMEHGGDMVMEVVAAVVVEDVEVAVGDVEVVVGDVEVVVGDVGVAVVCSDLSWPKMKKVNKNNQINLTIVLSLLKMANQLLVLARKKRGRVNAADSGMVVGDMGDVEDLEDVEDSET